MDKAKLWTNEGQPNNIQAFFSKSRFIRNPRSWLPRRGSCRLLPTEEVFASLPLSLRQAFPLGGKVDKANLWTNEEKLAFLFCLKICLTKNFQTKGLLHFRFKILNNIAIPFPIFPLAFLLLSPLAKFCLRKT